MTRKQAVQKAITIIAKHFELDPDKLADTIHKQKDIRGPRMKHAMFSLVYYMGQIGYTNSQIMRFIQKQSDQTRHYEAQGRLMMRGEHAKMINSLPMIERQQA